MTAVRKDVAVVVVGRNARTFLAECFQSLRAAQWRSYTYELIYVDNGSTDGTLEMLAQDFPEVRTIANSTNLGYCKAANQGARIAHSRYYFFLNDDTIVLDDAIPLLIEFLDREPHVGVAASRLLNTDLSDQWAGGRRFPSPATLVLGRRSVLARLFPNARSLSRYYYREQLQGRVPYAVDWASAAAMLVRSELFHDINGFAEDYYYWHEVVFCDRIRQAGADVFLHPLSKIVHHEGKGSGPRPYAVGRWHILDFHIGAYRCYCEHHGLSRLHPLRWIAATALALRGASLLALARLRATWTAA